MNLIRMTIILGGVALPAALYLGGCSSTASTPGFGNDAGGGNGSSSGGHSSSSSGGSSSGGTTSSSGGTTSSSGGTTSSSGGTTSSSGGTASSSGGTSSSGGSSADAACAQMSSNSACQQCCSTNHATGYQTFVNALLQCGCSATGGCQSACAATACASTPQNPDATCTTCLDNVQQEPDGGAGPCAASIQSACQADTDCINGFIACAQPCFNLP